jgi:hypothetical protein
MNKRLELTEEELAKVARRKRQDEKTKVSPEELFIAEFGLYFGWDGMNALMNNTIDMQTANTLVAGARKVWSRNMIDVTMAVFWGNASVNAGKKANQTLTKGLKTFIKESKADL